MKLRDVSDGSTKTQISNDYENDINNEDNENNDDLLESVSCYAERLHNVSEIKSNPIILPLKPKIKMNVSQTRIIPCKYAARGSCMAGDMCEYLHDEVSLNFIRSWENRL
ncbi:unnamed protein product [Didymodactylos carnosus]|uniref:C3H1-type domain-containing protein n=1 Tax=Didymodactylos carnosus TaxID=1234261 RepID=A0A8S2U5I9_9BILA|nr:unnamed protein product [Didymodactylos carnosus]CAF4315989.1 unnamed protein product [Didymodactylos carnosus]